MDVRQWRTVQKADDPLGGLKLVSATRNGVETRAVQKADDPLGGLKLVIAGNKTLQQAAEVQKADDPLGGLKLWPATPPARFGLSSKG